MQVGHVEHAQPGHDGVGGVGRGGDVNYVATALQKLRQRVDAHQKLRVEDGAADGRLQAQQHVVVVVAEALGVGLVVVQVGVAGGVEVVEVVVEAQLRRRVGGQGGEQEQHRQGAVAEFAKRHTVGPPGSGRAREAICPAPRILGPAESQPWAFGFCFRPHFYSSMNRAACLLGCLLLTPWPGRAQERYNRWEARPAPPPTPAASAEKRGEKVLVSKARQDSLNQVAAVAKLPLLRRGIGQRLKEGRGEVADAKYYEYVLRLVHYPIEAVRAATATEKGPEGIVIVRLTINAAGQVTNSSLVESTIPVGAPGQANMVQQAVSKLQLLRFEPAAGVTEEELKVSYRFM